MPLHRTHREQQEDGVLEWPNAIVTVLLKVGHLRDQRTYRTESTQPDPLWPQ